MTRGWFTVNESLLNVLTLIFDWYPFLYLPCHCPRPYGMDFFLLVLSASLFAWFRFLFSFIRLFYFFGVCSLRWPFPFLSLALWSSLMDAHTLFISCRVCCFNKLNNMVQQKATKVAGVGEMWADGSPQEKGLGREGFLGHSRNIESLVNHWRVYLKKLRKHFFSYT